ncbi:MAG: hypothetical protein AAFU79_26860 [Myxococcota bacterium]
MRKNMLCGLALAATGMMACGDDDADMMEPGGDDVEVISRVTTTFTPSMGATVTAVFDDPDGDGGMAPTVDSVTLAANTTYELTLRIENALENPIENITEEIEEEAGDHQVFFLGDAVTSNLLMVSYADTEADYPPNTGTLPVGLRSTVVTSSTGMGTLKIVLAHQPMLKTETSDQNVGDVDFDIDWAVTVQ